MQQVVGEEKKKHVTGAKTKRVAEDLANSLVAVILNLTTPSAKPRPPVAQSYGKTARRQWNNRE